MQNKTLFYTPPRTAQTNETGKSFNIDHKMIQNLGIPAVNFSKLTPSTVDHFVFVTGASSNHFEESIDAIAAIQHSMPNHTLYYYDLGLDTPQVDKVHIKLQ